MPFKMEFLNGNKMFVGALSRMPSAPLTVNAINTNPLALFAQKTMLLLDMDILLAQQYYSNKCKANPYPPRTRLSNGQCRRNQKMSHSSTYLSSPFASIPGPRRMWSHISSIYRLELELELVLERYGE